MEENMPQLLVGIPSRDPFFATQLFEKCSENSDQQWKKLMSLREGLRAMVQCYERQPSTDCYWLHEHPGGLASW